MPGIPSPSACGGASERPGDAFRYVVVDKARVYRRVFGSHVANVLRRLRRLARIYGAEPQFLLASATIANPGELGGRLLGLEATVAGSGSTGVISGAFSSTPVSETITGRLQGLPVERMHADGGTTRLTGVRWVLARRQLGERIMEEISDG